jgi:hypothetical protein
MLRECYQSQPTRPPRRAVFATFFSGALEVFHEGVGPRLVCSISRHGRSILCTCSVRLFLQICSRTFVLADLDTGADALADTSIEAFADALAAIWARADLSAVPGVIAVVLRS